MNVNNVNNNFTDFYCLSLFILLFTRSPRAGSGLQRYVNNVNNTLYKRLYIIYIYIYYIGRLLFLFIKFCRNFFPIVYVFLCLLLYNYICVKQLQRFNT